MDFKGVYVNRLQIYVEAMSYRDFRTMWIASFSAGAAAWALIVARGWLIYEISDSSMWVGIVTFAAMVPGYWSLRLRDIYLTNLIGVQWLLLCLVLILCIICYWVL